MKRLLFTVLLIVGFTSAQAQTPVSYSEVVQVEGVSKEDLYQRAREWFTDTFRSSNDVIQLDDKENGQIVGKAIFTYRQLFGEVLGIDCLINFKISVFCKEGRYKYDLTDFSHSCKWIELGTNGKWTFLDFKPISLGIITNEPPQYIGYTKNIEIAKENTQKVYNCAVEQIDEHTEGFIASLKKAMDSPTVVQSEDW